MTSLILGRRMLERALELSSGELFQANGELRGILQALPDVLFRVDANGAVIDLRQGGKAAAELPYRRPRIRGTADSSAVRFRDAVQAVRATGQAATFEYCGVENRRVSTKPDWCPF